MTHAFRLATLLALCASSTATYAQTASSSAFALSADERASVIGAADVTVSVGPVAQVSGSAPPAYNVNGGLASLNENTALIAGPLGLNQSLSTGILTTNASGTATAAEATATVNNLAFALNGLILDPALLGLSATTIQSFSQANSVGGLDASGMTMIEGLLLTGSLLDGIAIDLAALASPTANFELINAGGLQIVFNEQILAGDGITGTGITTNAIRISFDNFLSGTGVLNGDIIVGQTQAFASVGNAAAVPEPGTWAMMLLGFGAVGMAVRRTRRTQPALARA